RAAVIAVPLAAMLPGRRGARGSAWRAVRLPPIFLFYGLQNDFKKKAYNRWVVAPRIQRVVANAESTRRELLDLGWLLPERLKTIYDGVDPAPILNADATGLREELGAGPGDVVVLAAARLVPEKGHRMLVEVITRLIGDFPRLKVWLPGEGPEASGLR